MIQGAKNRFRATWGMVISRCVDNPPVCPYYLQCFRFCPSQLVNGSLSEVEQTPYPCSFIFNWLCNCVQTSTGFVSHFGYRMWFYWHNYLIPHKSAWPLICPGNKLRASWNGTHQLQCVGWNVIATGCSIHPWFMNQIYFKNQIHIAKLKMELSYAIVFATFETFLT